MWTISFWKDAFERMVWTFVEAFLGGLVGVAFLDIDAVGAAGIAGISAVASVLKSIAAGRMKKLQGGTAQLGVTTYTYA